MPLFQPSNITPSMLGEFGNGVIISNYDAGDPQTWNTTTFSWQVNGTEPMTAFEINLYEINTPNTLRWGSGKRTDGCPFYPTDANGNAQMFSFSTLYQYLHDPADGGFSGSGTRANYTYLMYITQYWGTGGSEQSLTMVSPAQAVTVNRGVVSFTNLTEGDTLTGKSQTITAQFTQDGDAAVQLAKWDLWLGSAASGEKIYSTGWLNTQQLSFTYDGFMPSQAYAIQCTVESNYGIVTESDAVNFSIADATETWEGGMEACSRPDLGGVLVEFSAPRVIPATFSSDEVGAVPLWQPRYTALDGYDNLLLRSIDTIAWDTVNGSAMSYAAPWSLVWDGILTAETATLITATTDNHTIEVKTDAQTLYIYVDGALASSNPTKYVSLVGRRARVLLKNGYAEIRVGETPYYDYRTDEGNMISFTAYDAYMPSLLLDESNTLHGTYAVQSLGPMDEFAVESSLSYMTSPAWTDSLTEISLAGSQEAHFVWVGSADLTGTEAWDASLTPSWASWGDQKTVFLTDFANQSTYGGNINLNGDYVGADLYRNKVGENSYEYIGTAGPTENKIVDVSAKSQEKYQYLLFIKDNDEYEPITAVVTPCFWEWTLFSCTENVDGSYTPVEMYRFRYNVETGSMSNNNAPTVLQNFTPYPTILMATANYKSGVLGGYIGKVSVGQYSEQIATRDALFALSTSSNALFLRNRKGDFLRVSLSAPISATVADNTRQQAESISVPWVEIADTERVKVVLHESDALYNELTD